MNQANSLRAVAHRDAETHNLTIDCIQRGVPRPGGGIACSPFSCPTEIALPDQPVFLKGLVDFDVFALDEVVVLPAFHAAPWHSVMSELSHRDGRFVGENIGDFLIGAPIGAAHGIEEMHSGTIALRFGAVGKRCLHASLRGAAMTASRRHQREDERLMSRRRGLYGTTFASQATADHQHVGRNQARAHVDVPSSKNASGGSIQPASTISVTPPNPSTTQKMTCSRRCIVLRDIHRSAPHLIARRYRPTLA